MSNRWAAWPRVRWLIGAVAVVLALVIVWALLVPGADWLARHDIGSAKESLAAARDAARGRLLALGAGLFAAGALLFTARNFTLSRRTFELTEQGQVTDRFTKAIEQLGSDKLDVRIGGIYALERIARDSAKDHPTVIEVLTAFIRVRGQRPPPPDTGQPVQERGGRIVIEPTWPDVEAAFTVIGRRDAKRDIQRIDLNRANLGNAILTRADLAGANLTGANLIRANLTDANLEGADLTRADLTRADLTGADLTGANLGRADLGRANLTGADLGRADLTGANLGGADLTRADLTDVRWPAGVPVPDGWTADSGSGRLKHAGQLSEVMTHYL